MSRISREEARPKVPPHGEIPEVKDGKADCPPGHEMFGLIRSALRYP